MGRTTLWQEKEKILSSTVFRVGDNIEEENEEKTVNKVCQSCMSVVGPGLPHKCSDSTLSKNINNLVESCSEKNLNKIIHASLKTQFNRSEISLKGGTLKLPRVGSSGSSGLQVRVGKSTPMPPRKFMTSDLMKLQKKLFLSDKSIF